MTATKALAAMAAAAIGAAGCGSGEKPAGGNGADRAFVAAMVPHHQSALDMAQIARERAESDFVKDLADDIIRTQTTEIAKLNEEDAGLAEAGVEEGDLGVEHSMMGMDGDVASLRTATPFDKAFLELMIPHHEGAVTMSEAELDKGGDPELRQLAKDIITAQQREIEAMTDHLGGDPSGGHHTM